MGYGDSILDSGAVRIAQQTDPRKCKVILGRKRIWSEVWDNNPRIAKFEDEGDFNYIFGRHPDSNMRPYHKAKTDKRWIYNLDYRPTVGEIYFKPYEVNFGKIYFPEVIIEPNIKRKANPNKQYPWELWQQFAYMATREGIKLSQLGPPGTRTLNGVPLIETPSFRHACSVLSRAKAYVGHEGGMHHAAAALNVKGVVIFGGFTPVELTGYEIHRNIGSSLDDACGMRVHCDHCAKAMSEITPEQILKELKGVL